MIDRLGYQNIQTHFVDFDKEKVAERLRIKEYGKWVIQLEAEEWDQEHQFIEVQKMTRVWGCPTCQSFRILLQAAVQNRFVRGHGEDLISNTSVDGLSDWGQYLEQGGFVLEDISMFPVKNGRSRYCCIGSTEAGLSKLNPKPSMTILKCLERLFILMMSACQMPHFLTIWACPKWKELLRIRILFFHIGTDLS